MPLLLLEHLPVSLLRLRLYLCLCCLPLCCCSLPAWCLPAADGCMQIMLLLQVCLTVGLLLLLHICILDSCLSTAAQEPAVISLLLLLYMCPTCSLMLLLLHGACLLDCMLLKLIACLRGACQPAASHMLHVCSWHICSSTLLLLLG